MTDTNYDHIDDLINKEFTLQRDVLASWHEIHKLKLKHDALLGALAHVREEIRRESGPSLYEELFGEPEPNR